MSGTRFTAEYRSIEKALLLACARLALLEEEVRAYKSKSREEIWEEIREQYDIRSHGNIKWTDEEFDQYKNERIDIYIRPDIQMERFIDGRYEAEFITIVLTSAALVEAMINACLQYLLAKVGKNELFALVDKWTVLEKWEHGVKLVIKDFSFPKATKLWDVLKGLITVRNAALHYKPMLEIDGKRMYVGKSIFQQVVKDQMCWLKRASNLPYELHYMLRCEFAKGPGRFEEHHDPHIMLMSKMPFPDHQVFTPDFILEERKAKTQKGRKKKKTEQ